MADNCEHVLAAAPFIGGLRRPVPRDGTLDQPRAAHTAGRRAPPCPAARAAEPAAPKTQKRRPAGPLSSCSRARTSSRSGFERSDGSAAPVAEICRRVDGLPLAIELAAARCGLLSPAEIAERLDTRSVRQVRTRDAPARQQTLRATIDWSQAAHRG